MQHYLWGNEKKKKRIVKKIRYSIEVYPCVLEYVDKFNLEMRKIKAGIT